MPPPSHALTGQHQGRCGENDAGGETLVTVHRSATPWTARVPNAHMPRPPTARTGERGGERERARSSDAAPMAAPSHTHTTRICNFHILNVSLKLTL